MRLTLLVLSIAACALGACTPQPAENAVEPANASNDIDDAVLANTIANGQAPVVRDAPANAAAPASEGPFAQESAQGAADVVQTYYALIGEGKYRQAWALWGDGGKASGMRAGAFAASFARYADYHANIGAPGAIDAGAGQRYVTVPVQVYGRLKEGGRPFNLIGSVTLHRTGDIDGATAEQKQWRIKSADLVARPGPEASPTPEAVEDNRSVARYRCMDGTKLTARFDPDARQVTVEPGKGGAHLLNRQGTSTGIRYAGGGYAFGGKGDNMTFTAPGLPPIPCTAIR